MMDFFASIIGHIVNFIVILGHAANIVFRNFVLLAFVLAFLWGIFRLCQNGWHYLRRRNSPETHQSAPGDPTHNGGG